MYAMKNLTLTILTVILIALFSCDKDESNLQKTPANKVNVGSNGWNKACEDHPSKDSTLCQAAFTRWFFDPVTGNCSEIGYTGCDLIGFATQAECTSCICNITP